MLSFSGLSMLADRSAALVGLGGRPVWEADLSGRLTCSRGKPVWKADLFKSMPLEVDLSRRFTCLGR